MNTISPEVLFETHRLTKNYGDFSLQTVDLKIHEGEIIGLIGKNGAGKSTIIKALLGLIPIDAGEAHILGTPCSELSKKGGATTKEHIGVVFDTLSLPNHLKISDIAKMYDHAYSSWDMSYFHQLLQDMNLTTHLSIKNLSRGMGMKLSLACALAHDPHILILDEATAGLDPMARDEILDTLRAFVAKPRRAILMSSHISSDLEHVADRIVCLDDGRKIFDLETDEITDMAGIARCRAQDFQHIRESGKLTHTLLRVLQRDYGIDVLVPDRITFMQQFPTIPCDRVCIDDYMTFTLNGSVYS